MFDIFSCGFYCRLLTIFFKINFFFSKKKYLGTLSDAQTVWFKARTVGPEIGPNSLHSDYIALCLTNVK